MRWGRVVVFAVIVILLLAVTVGVLTHHSSSPAPSPVAMPAPLSTSPSVTPTPVPPTVTPTPPVATPTMPPKLHPSIPKIKPTSRPAHAPIPAPTPRPVPVAPYVPPVILPPEPVAPTEWKGVDTHVTHAGQVVVKTDEQWIHFWTEHHPHEASPDVDFSKLMVIGVFAGSRPADAFAISIIAVRPVGNALVVDYQERTPPTGTFAVGVEIFPYHLKAIPKSPLPVKFNRLQPTS